MKSFAKLISLILWGTLCACTPKFYENRITQDLSFKEYNDAGFYISPFDEVAGFEYLPIHSHLLQISTNKEWSSNNLLHEMVKKAIHEEANGILNCKVTAVPIIGAYGQYGTTYTISGDFIQFKGQGPLGPVDYTKIKLLQSSISNLRERSDYDYRAAESSTKFYIIRKDGEKLYLDPETDKHISRKVLLEKYKDTDIKELERMQNESF